MSNLTIFRGDHAYTRIIVRDNMNEVLDISWGSIVLTLISELGTKIEVDGVIADGTDGVAIFILTPTHTNEIGTYRYDVQLTTGEDIILTVDSGTINIISDISV